ncbi:MAG: CpeT protein [Cryomorphaceae bacterium]|jgi:hypothetical protein
MKKTAISSFLILIVSFGYSQEKSENFLQLLDWMSGEFSSAEQAANEATYDDITLKMIHIWPKKKTGAWIYVEQALASRPNQPYFQRVYFLREMGDGQFSSDIYIIPEQEKFIGAWKDASQFVEVDQFDLKYQDGCAVFLDYDGFQYSGSTNAETCKSSLQGASYATSEIKVTKGVLESWERGYDAEGNQVWGAEKGAYVFKIND